MTDWRLNSTLSGLFCLGRVLRGTAAVDSDYDVLVIVESNIPFIERQGVALLALGKHPYPVDLLVYTPAEAAAEAAMLGSAVYWAKKGGKVYLA